MVKAVNQTEFDELLYSGKTIVCDFWASWCGPCRMLAPVMEAVSEEFTEAEFIKVNVDDEEELAARYGVMSIPFVAIFVGGKLKTRSVGYLPEEQMKEFLNLNL